MPDPVGSARVVSMTYWNSDPEKVVSVDQLIVALLSVRGLTDSAVGTGHGRIDVVNEMVVHAEK